MRSIKRWTKVLLCIVLALVLLVGAYVVYVFAAYHRIGDQVLTPGGTAATQSAAAGQSYQVTSYNIGFGAYESGSNRF